MLSEKMGDVVKVSEPARPEVEEMRARIRKDVSNGLAVGAAPKA